MPTRRNPVVRAGAILRKGGVHRQSASGHRHQGKRSLCDELDEWYADEQDADDSKAVFDCNDKTGTAEYGTPRKRKGWGSTPRSFALSGYTDAYIGTYISSEGSDQMMSGMSGSRVG